MSRGKTTCKILKEVRRKIADANGIPLQERECTHTGDVVVWPVQDSVWRFPTNCNLLHFSHHNKK